MIRKLFLSVVLTAIIISGLIFVSTLRLSTAQTSTNVSGVISSDTTWMQANSPYNVTGDVLINNGVTLTIEPGVFVNLNSHHIMVNGTLQAIGSGKNPIYIIGDTSAEIVFTPFAADWNQSIGTGCIIENANIGPYMAMYNSPEINYDNVYGRINTNANATISNCFIYGGISITGGQGKVTNNTVTSPFGSMGHGIIISINAENATVSDNTITACTEGITVYIESGLNPGNCTSLIEGNLIIDNTYGIKIVAFSGPRFLNPLIQSNTITSNDYGIYFASYSSEELAPTTIIENNIFNNNIYNVLSNVTDDVDATNNWWGTTDTQSINQTIYDFKNDPNWGNVSFVPFLDSPNTQAPTFVNASAGDGGFIVPSGYVSINYGGSQTFNITVDPGYHILDVLVNGTSVGAVNSYTIQNIQGATTISATFAPNPTPPPSSTPTPSPSPTSSPSPSPTAAPNPTPTATPAPTPTATPIPAPTSTPTPTSEDFSTALVAASAVVATFAGLGLLLFFKKRKR